MSFILLYIFFFFLTTSLSYQHKSKHLQLTSSYRQATENESECKNNGNKTDEINFNLCSCPKNYFGRFCEFDNEQSAYDEATKLINLIDEISSTNSLQESETQTNILTLIQLKKQIQELNIDEIKKHKELLDAFVPQNENEYNVLLCLSGLVITAYLEENSINNLNIVQDIINNINLKIQNIDIGNEGFIIKQIPLQDIYFHKIITKQDIIDKYINKATKASISYIHAINFTEDESSYFYISKTQEYSNSTSNTISINVQYFPNKLMKTEYNNMNNEKLYIYYSINDYEKSFSKEKVVLDKDKAIFYYKMGINIYNIYDPAFFLKCYKNQEHYFYKYDLTQKYRKKQLYQNKTFASESNDDLITCYRIDVNYTKGYIMVNCPSFTNYHNGLTIFNSLYSLYFEDDTYNEVDVLPLRCSLDFKRLKINYAFWYYIWFIPIFTFLNIFFWILFTYICKCKDDPYLDEKNLLDNSLTSSQTESKNDISNTNNEDLSKRQAIPKNDDIMIYDKENKDKTKRFQNLEIDIPTNEQQQEKKKDEKKSFCHLYAHNLKLLHPLIIMSYHSWTTSSYFNIITYFFSVSVLNGFNNIYYSEDLIEKRLYMKETSLSTIFKNEIHICVFSVLTMILFVVLARLFIISYPSTRRSLLEYWQNNQHDKIQQFQKCHRIRIISCCVIMIALSIFLIIYSIYYVDMYVATAFVQYTLLMFTLFFIWACLSPLHILLVTFLESRENISRDVIYYIKKLTIF